MRRPFRVGKSQEVNLGQERTWTVVRSVIGRILWPPGGFSLGRVCGCAKQSTQTRPVVLSSMITMYDCPCRVQTPIPSSRVPGGLGQSKALRFEWPSRGPTDGSVLHRKLSSDGPNTSTPKGGERVDRKGSLFGSGRHSTRFDSLLKTPISGSTHHKCRFSPAGRRGLSKSRPKRRGTPQDFTNKPAPGHWKAVAISRSRHNRTV